MIGKGQQCEVCGKTNSDRFSNFYKCRCGDLVELLKEGDFIEVHTPCGFQEVKFVKIKGGFSAPFGFERIITENERGFVNDHSLNDWRFKKGFIKYNRKTYKYERSEV